MKFDDPINVVIECCFCEAEHTMTVSKQDLIKRNHGALIQNCFPYLTPDQREMFITGMCGKCFDKAVGKD